MGATDVRFVANKGHIFRVTVPIHNAISLTTNSLL